MLTLLKRLAILVVVGSVMVVVWAWSAYDSALNDSVVTEGGRFIEINKGDSFRTVVRKLQQEGADISPFWTEVVAYRYKLTHRLKAGEYPLEVGMTVPQLLQSFVAGKVRQYAITFPEGITFRQILQLLAKNQALRHTLNETEYSAIMAQLGLPDQHPEGLFFPETYYFAKHSSDVALLKRAYAKMQYVLQQEWLNRQDSLPLSSPYEALILASIVEKETAVPAERAQIAGVFIRRLQKKMLLQTDPTVIYGIGERFDGNIRRRDLREATPYNTYVISGLPPTPIAMPGQEAIHAVLHPAEGNSLYFVARGDGSHVFSASLREHNQAVKQYQKNNQ